jgi:hypothetical protein
MPPFDDFLGKINAHCFLVVHKADHESATRDVRLAILWVFPES